MFKIIMYLIDLLALDYAKKKRKILKILKIYKNWQIFHKHNQLLI